MLKSSLSLWNFRNFACSAHRCSSLHINCCVSHSCLFSVSISLKMMLFLVHACCVLVVRVSFNACLWCHYRKAFTVHIYLFGSVFLLFPNSEHTFANSEKTRTRIREFCLLEKFTFVLTYSKKGCMEINQMYKFSSAGCKIDYKIHWEHANLRKFYYSILGSSRRYKR